MDNVTRDNDWQLLNTRRTTASRHDATHAMARETMAGIAKIYAHIASNRMTCPANQRYQAYAAHHSHTFFSVPTKSPPSRSAMLSESSPLRSASMS